MKASAIAGYTCWLLVRHPPGITRNHWSGELFSSAFTSGTGARTLSQIGEDLVQSGQLRMFTALEMTNATVRSDASDWIIISNFAQAVSGIVSVGLNAVALVNDV